MAPTPFSEDLSLQLKGETPQAAGGTSLAEEIGRGPARPALAPCITGTAPSSILDVYWHETRRCKPRRLSHHVLVQAAATAAAVLSVSGTSRPKVQGPMLRADEFALPHCSHGAAANEL